MSARAKESVAVEGRRRRWRVTRGGGIDSVVTTNFRRWRQSILFGYMITLKYW